MRIIHALRSAALAGLLLLAARLPVAASEPQTLRYQIEVAGVQLGRIEVRAEEGAETVDARVAWVMDGFIGLLPRGEGDMEGRGRMDDGEVVPARFRGLYAKPDRRREVRIRYDEAGAIEELRLTSNGEARKSDVPKRLRDRTVDTLTAFWRLRHWAVEEKEKPLTLSVFDGRRRYDLHARHLGRETVERDGREMEAERIELRLVPRAGFDDNEVFGSKVDPDEPWAEVLVSRGEQPVPLMATGTGRLAWRITLEE